MALRITSDMFSGRPNPVVELNERESKSVLERLRPTRPLKRTEPGLPPLSTLEYWGLIEQTGARAKWLPKSFRLANADVVGPELAHQVADDAFEDFFCGSTGPIRRVELGRQFPAFLRKEIERFSKVRLKYPWTPIPWPRQARCRVVLISLRRSSAPLQYH